MRARTPSIQSARTSRCRATSPVLTDAREPESVGSRSLGCFLVETLGQLLDVRVGEAVQLVAGVEHALESRHGLVTEPGDVGRHEQALALLIDDAQRDQPRTEVGDVLLGLVATG